MNSHGTAILPGQSFLIFNQMKKTYNPEVRDTSKWTKFYDMHSGGGRKLEWELIFINADEITAIKIFEKMFDRDPTNVTCSCCGEDYAIHEYTSIDKATSYYRGKMSIEQYMESDGAVFITVDQSINQ